MVDPKGARASIFSVPGRGIAPPTSQFQRSAFVATEQELRNAIGSAAARAASATLTAAFGTEIVLVKPIRLKAPVDLPSTVPGLTIRSQGRVPLMSTGLLDYAFLVRGPMTTLRDLFVYVDADVTQRFATFVRAGEWVASLAPNWCVLENNVVFADQFYDDPVPSFMPQTWRIVGNNFNMGADARPAINGPMERADISGNSFDGATAAIDLGGASQHNRIEDNYLGGGSVTTNAGLGNNVIAVNTRAGAIAAAGTDQVGLNT